MKHDQSPDMKNTNATSIPAEGQQSEHSSLTKSEEEWIIKGAGICYHIWQGERLIVSDLSYAQAHAILNAHLSALRDARAAQGDAEKMRAEHKRLLDIYTEASNWAGMGPDANFDDLPKFVEAMRNQINRLMRLRPSAALISTTQPPESSAGGEAEIPMAPRTESGEAP